MYFNYFFRFESNKGLVSLRLELLLKLWKAEPRTYIYLQRALEADFSPPNERIKINYMITKAHCIVKICQEKASNHGADLLKLLNSLLNSSDNVTVLKLSLKGILILCQEGVIDIMTTLKVLAPKFSYHPKAQVAQKFYQLLALAPTFQLDHEDFILFLKSNLTMLWKSAYDKTLHDLTRSAIVQAMVHFKLELHELPMLPQFAQDLVARSEDVENTSIPGQCWISILKNAKDLEAKEISDAFEKLVAKFSQDELTNFPRGIYNLSQAMKNRLEEHPNYNFLPENSVIRAIVHQFLDEKRAKNVEKGLLSTLFGLEHQHLPPFDWKLISPVMMSLNKFQTIGFLAKQLPHSFSAKAILENLLQTWSSCEIALEIMPHFSHVIKGEDE